MGVMKFLCSIVSTVKSICYTVKVVDVLCYMFDTVVDAVIGSAKRRLAAFRLQVVEMFYVSLEVEHSMKMNTTASRSMKEVVSAVIKEIENRTEKIRPFFSGSIAIPGLAFIYMFLKVYFYKYKFMTSDSFDNRYITKRIVQLDLTRIKRDLPTALPLELRERSVYTTVTSVGLLSNERRSLIIAFSFLFFATIEVASYLSWDYAIYWISTVIRQQGLSAAGHADLPSAGVQIEGAGALANLYQQVGGAFQPPSPNLDLDPVPCLPEPSPPDYPLYIQIVCLLCISWLMAITEPYGLRARSVVMSYYYPGRAQQRAVWLHNHILLTRGTFMNFIRQEINRRLHKADTNGPPVSFWQKLIHRNRILMKVFGSKLNACLVCGALQGDRASQQLSSCPALNCQALYCPYCRPKLAHCILCYEPLQIDVDLDGIEAVDSSEDEMVIMEEEPPRTESLESQLIPIDKQPGSSRSENSEVYSIGITPQSSSIYSQQEEEDRDMDYVEQGESDSSRPHMREYSSPDNEEETNESEPLLNDRGGFPNGWVPRDTFDVEIDRQRRRDYPIHRTTQQDDSTESETLFTHRRHTRLVPRDTFDVEIDRQRRRDYPIHRTRQQDDSTEAETLFTHRRHTRLNPAEEFEDFEQRRRYERNRHRRDTETDSE